MTPEKISTTTMNSTTNVPIKRDDDSKERSTSSFLSHVNSHRGSTPPHDDDDDDDDDDYKSKIKRNRDAPLRYHQRDAVTCTASCPMITGNGFAASTSTSSPVDDKTTAASASFAHPVYNCSDWYTIGYGGPMMGGCGAPQSASGHVMDIAAASAPGSLFGREMALPFGAFGRRPSPLSPPSVHHLRSTITQYT